MILTFGPFLGDWKQELFTFRPYIKWITENIPHNDVYVSTHINRLFLYDWIPEQNKIPIYEELTRDEFSQTGYININISKKDYNIIQKKFKESIKSDDTIENFFLSYNTTMVWYPLYNKSFTKIKFTSAKKDSEKYVLFIPDNSENTHVLQSIYNELRQEYNVLVVGDMKTHLPEHNVILKNADYFDNVYKYLVEYILNAEIVVCPSSHWTLLCNIHDIPVFSWSSSPKQQIFNNLERTKKSHFIINADKDTIINGIKYFINTLRS